MTKYSVGDIVQVRNTGQVVSISKISETESAVFYYVIVDKKRKRYREEDLIPYVDTEESIEKDFEEQRFCGADQFQLFVYYHQFSESQEKNIYSVQGNKIIFNPFQYKPLLKFMSIDSDERLLVADEVGVGKTIETAIILDELFARGDLQSRDTVLIVCPSVLRYKWQEELRHKFQMDDFQVFNSERLKYSLKVMKEGGRNPIPHGIVSEQLIRGEQYRELLEECWEASGGPFIGLLIIDECHHYRNPETSTHRVGAFLSMCAERVIMLSATPYNLHSSDLFNQLNMLNPALFPAEDVFAELRRQIRNVNTCISLLRDKSPTARLELSENLALLHPLAEHNQLIKRDFEELLDHIERADDLSIKDIVKYESTLNLLNPISSSFTRTLKRDAIEHRVTRDVRTIEVHLTDAEAKIYNDFVEVNMLRHEYNGVSERAFGLIANGLERIAASSVVALERNVYHFMKKAGLDVEEVLENDLGLNESLSLTMRDILKQKYYDLIVQIHALNGVDTKYDAFKKLITNIQNISPENPRILVFSFYVGTLKYLRKKLTENGYRVALMYGETPFDTPSKVTTDDEGFSIIGRSDLMKAFKNGDFDILLVSEVGGEGLDFQFCTSMINYDLPYNPMRIEQRIGRIDRMGQMSDKIIVGSLCLEDTIDVVIKDVLLSRINDATDLIGELEPIITQEMEEINQMILRREFTPQELEKRKRELSARIEKERMTREEFDRQRYELVNDKGFREEFEESIRNSRISPRDSLLFTIAFLKGINGCWSKRVGDYSAVIHITKDIREKLSAYYKRIDSATGGNEIKSLIDSEADIPITFSGDEAYHNSELLFVKPSGAWIHFMIDYLKVMNEDLLGNLFHLAVKTEFAPRLRKGTYIIFIYDFEFTGFRNTNITSYILVDTSTMETIVLEDEEWKSIFQNVQDSKRPVNLTVSNIEDARFSADEASDSILSEIQKRMTESNDIKIVSRMNAIRAIADIQIREQENNLIGAPEKEAEKIRRAIRKETKKTEEKLNILEKKRLLSTSASFQGMCVMDII